MLKARLSGILPDMRRLYRDGELRPGGIASGVFIKFVLTADKPFIRKVNGLLAHQANYFGPPYCSCSDKDLYKFTFNKKTHYGKITFGILCNRAHVAEWEALGEAEPDKWCFACDCCKEVSPPRHSPLHPCASTSPQNYPMSMPLRLLMRAYLIYLIYAKIQQVFDSEKGGMAKLDAERTRKASLDDDVCEKEDVDFSALHKATRYDCCPLLPFTHVVFDPMHAMHNEINLISDEARAYDSYTRGLWARAGGGSDTAYAVTLPQMLTHTSGVEVAEAGAPTTQRKTNLTMISRRQSTST